MTINDYVGVKLSTEKLREEFVKFISDFYIGVRGSGISNVGAGFINGFFADNCMDHDDCRYYLYSNEGNVEYAEDEYWMLGRVSFEVN